MSMEKCERCGTLAPIITTGTFAGSRETHNYCDLCSENLCDECMNTSRCFESSGVSHVAHEADDDE